MERKFLYQQPNDRAGAGQSGRGRVVWEDMMAGRGREKARKVPSILTIIRNFLK